VPHRYRLYIPNDRQQIIYLHRHFELLYLCSFNILENASFQYEYNQYNAYKKNFH